METPRVNWYSVYWGFTPHWTSGARGFGPLSISMYVGNLISVRDVFSDVTVRFPSRRLHLDICIGLSNVSPLGSVASSEPHRRGAENTTHVAIPVQCSGITYIHRRLLWYIEQEDYHSTVYHLVLNFAWTRSEVSVCMYVLCRESIPCTSLVAARSSTVGPPLYWMLNSSRAIVRKTPTGKSHSDWSLTRNSLTRRWELTFK